MLRIVAALLFTFTLAAQTPGELRFCLRGEPKTFNPLLVEDESSETIRYLTAGVLVRLNRYTQELEGSLLPNGESPKTAGESISICARTFRFPTELRSPVKMSPTPFVN